ncbi:MAG: hypothetical protein ACRD1X_07205 [Vicinamibacteria bacterium]
MGGCIAGAWLVAIAINWVSTGTFLDVAVRDLLMALAAFTLARLSEVRETADSRDPAPGSLGFRNAGVKLRRSRPQP